MILLQVWGMMQGLTMGELFDLFWLTRFLWESDDWLNIANMKFGEHELCYRYETKATGAYNKLL